MATKRPTKKTKPEEPAPMTVSISVPDDVRTPLTFSRATAVTDATVVSVKTWYDDAKAELKRREAIFDKLKKPLNELRNTILALEKDSCKTLAAEIAYVGGLLVKYQHDKDEVRRLAEEKAKREADEKARADRQRQLDALNAAAAATPVPEHREAIQQQAQQIAAAPLRVVPQAVMMPAPVVKIPTRETWTGEVYDLTMLVAATAIPVLLKVAQAQREAISLPIDHPNVQKMVNVIEWLQDAQEMIGKGGLEYLQPNQSAVNDLGRECHNEVPVAGIRGVRKETPLAGGNVQAPVATPVDEVFPASENADEWRV